MFCSGWKEKDLKRNVSFLKVCTLNPVSVKILTGFVRVLEILESPGILLSHFPGLESPGKVMLVLESPGNLLN